jgi:hypothetical protein
MTLLPLFAALLAGGGPSAADHRAVFRDFALQFACLALAGPRRARRAASRDTR